MAKEQAAKEQEAQHQAEAAALACAAAKLAETVIPSCNSPAVARLDAGAIVDAHSTNEAQALDHAKPHRMDPHAPHQTAMHRTESQRITPNQT